MKMFCALHHKMKLKQIFLPVVLLLCVGVIGFSQSSAPKVETAILQGKLQVKLDELHKNGKFPGATVGICLADENCFGLATGFSDRDAKTRMKPSDIMLAGSVGKTYAAAVALQLVKEGKINLDEKVEKYLG